MPCRSGSSVWAAAMSLTAKMVDQLTHRAGQIRARDR